MLGRDYFLVAMPYSKETQFASLTQHRRTDESFILFKNKAVIGWLHTLGLNINQVRKTRYQIIFFKRVFFLKKTKTKTTRGIFFKIYQIQKRQKSMIHQDYQKHL